jgi:hypothetical protein
MDDDVCGEDIDDYIGAVMEQRREQCSRHQQRETAISKEDEITVGVLSPCFSLASDASRDVLWYATMQPAAPN